MQLAALVNEMRAAKRAGNLNRVREIETELKAAADAALAPALRSAKRIMRAEGRR